jgi:hypothetical protein
MFLESLLGVGTGLIGTITTSFINLKTQKLSNEHQLLMRDKDIEERKQEATTQIAIDSQQISGAIDNLETQAYLESLKGANADLLTDAKLQALTADKHWTSKVLAFLMGLVDTFRASVRPLLTIYLVVLTTVITNKSIVIISSKSDLLTTAQAQDLFVQVTNIVLYLTVAVVTWWFGDRRTAKFLFRLNDGNKIDDKGF